jgi:hypothetical protein
MRGRIPKDARHSYLALLFKHAITSPQLIGDSLKEIRSRPMIIERTKILEAYNRVIQQLGEHSHEQACAAVSQALGNPPDVVSDVVMLATQEEAAAAQGVAA